MSLDSLPAYSIDHTTSIEAPSKTKPLALQEIFSSTNEKLSGIRLELQESVEQKEKRVYDILVQKTLKKSVQEGGYPEGISVHFLGENIFSVTDNNSKNINYYVDANGEILFNTAVVLEFYGIDNGKVFSDLGLKFEKVAGTYVLSRNDGEVINQETKEGYETWRDVIFHSDVLHLLSLLKTPVELDEGWLDGMISLGPIRFKDLEALKRRGALQESVFQCGIKKIAAMLPSQCDPRSTAFRRLASYQDIYSYKTDPTKRMAYYQSDILDAIKKWYITEEVGKSCIAQMPKALRDGE